MGGVRPTNFALVFNNFHLLHFLNLTCSFVSNSFLEGLTRSAQFRKLFKGSVAFTAFREVKQG
jgi:hypothetical protein